TLNFSTRFARFSSSRSAVIALPRSRTTRSYSGPKRDFSFRLRALSKRMVPRTRTIATIGMIQPVVVIFTSRPNAGKHPARIGRRTKSVWSPTRSQSVFGKWAASGEIGGWNHEEAFRHSVIKLADVDVAGSRDRRSEAGS